jgi:hypothetical protein
VKALSKAAQADGHVFTRVAQPAISATGIAVDND